uniref:IQ motif containing M n=1 Tax=Molossus molossus TaxID=27622 RepID=A0A7J8I809_MOLMO|nr:IQ motif containing M [Molossus molossus]
MTGTEASSSKTGPVLEITQQDFFQEAKTLIAQHHEKINENKVQDTSINVFRNKHLKLKSGKFIPLEIRKKETLDVVQELQIAHKHICFPKDVSKCEHFEEPPQQTAFKEPHIFNVKEKFKSPIDLIAKEKAFYDWRGIVSIRSSSLACDFRFPSFSEYSTKLKKRKIPFKPEPQRQPRVQQSLSKSDKFDSKVKRIGPHIEIFQVFRERSRMIITKKTINMITLMQAHVRGWLERKRFQRIMVKALYHGPNLRAVINMYCRQIHRIKHRLGLWRTRQIINFAELEEWMDRKKFYETMFAKREYWQGLERSELLKFFNDCGHFPTQQQIDQIWDLVHKDNHEKYSEIIKKSNAIEMLFTLYPPQGAHVQNRQLKSTWLRPVVNGEEGYKYIVSGHPILKRANIQIVGKLVSTSIRERKMRQRYVS